MSRHAMYGEAPVTAHPEQEDHQLDGITALPVHGEDGGASISSVGRVTRLTIREAGRVFFVPVRTIDWIEGADYYVKLHVEGRVQLMRESLRSLEQRLDTAEFVRIHRSAIVNLTRIREIRIALKGDHVIVLNDATRLRLTRTRRRDLEAMIERASE